MADTDYTPTQGEIVSVASIASLVLEARDYFDRKYGHSNPVGDALHSAAQIISQAMNSVTEA